MAVVTGAAGGFGRATAERLLREGARVALWDIDPRVAVAARELDRDGQAALAIAVDVGDSAAVDRAAAQTRETLVRSARWSTTRAWSTPRARGR